MSFGGAQLFTMGSSGNTFTPSSAAMPSSQGNPGAKPKQQQEQACLPVTIRIIETTASEHGSSDEPLRFHGVVEPSVVVMVAAVEDLVKQPASLEMQLNDGTGRMKARFYMTENAPQGLERIETGRYVAVVGNVRTAPALHLSIVHARVIESANEISYHSIAAAHAALKVRRNASAKPMSAMDAVMEATPEKKKKVSELPSEETPEKKMSPAAAMMQVEPTPAPVAMKVAVAPLLDRIRAVLTRDAAKAGPSGVTVQDVFAGLADASVSSADVQAKIQQLVEDGEIFPTIDDDHFAPV